MVGPGLQFTTPGVLAFAALAVVPFLRLGRPRVAWPLDEPRGPTGGWRRWIAPSLRALAILCIVVGLAGPFTALGTEPRRGSGAAIVAALDVSRSMRTSRDELGTSRLQRASDALLRFLDGRPEDLVGIVAFSSHPDTSCPPTLDRAFVRETARALTIATPDDAGTALGDAIIWAAREALATSARRRVVVLITDGRHEPGRPDAIAPVEAAALAHAQGVIVHALAIAPGTGGDEARLELEAMTRAGGGAVFEASGPDGLDAAFAALDALEHSELSVIVRTRIRSWSPEFLAAALGLLVAEVVLRWTRLRTMP